MTETGTPVLMVRQDDPDQHTTTPTVRRTLRRILIWVVGAVLALIVASLVYSALRGGTEQGVPLAADNPAPQGAMALAEVLRQQGVDVIETATLDETADAAGKAGDVTVLLWDIDVLLDSDQHDRLRQLSRDLVVLDPTFGELEDLAPGVAQAGFADGTFDADCDVPAVQQAGSVTATGSSYRLLDDAADGTVGCLADGDRFGIVQRDSDGETVTLVGLTDAFTNEHIAEDGNAALALNLLGGNATLIWYIPTAADLAEQPAPNIADLTPPWVTPLAVMLLLTAVGAMFWRARRVGPLVVEDLPVVVRASETMEGRARLYERSDAALHALDSLRIGAVSRLARTCGLPRTATVAEVVDAVAALTGRDRASVAHILVDAVPGTDADLVTLSDALLTLENDAAAHGRP
jgi:hypothetical protein